MALATLVAPMMMGKHEQIEGLLGDLPFATLKRGTHERIHPLDQRGRSYNGVEFVESQRFEGGTRVAEEPCGARQPEVSFLLMVPLWLRPRLRDEMLMVPRQHEKISGLVRSHGTEFSMHGFSLCKRDDNVIESRAQGLARVGNGGAVECCDPVEKPRECCAHVFDGAQAALRRASLPGCTQHVEEHGALGVECPGLLTGVRRGVILVETLCQMRLACGAGKLVRCVVFLANGGLGFALPWGQHLAEVATLVAIIRHPQGHGARGLVAGDEAKAPIRGHAKAEDLVSRQRFDMCSPGVS